MALLIPRKNKEAGLISAYWPPYKSRHDCLVEGVDAFLQYGSELIEDYIDLNIRTSDMDSDF